ncbi:Hsp90 cochaperone [Balamuthia mandrillaris]
MQSSAQKAEELKSRGNEAFKAQDYTLAVRCYTEALQHDPNNHLLYSNRSMCLFKLGKYFLSSNDADHCLRLQPAFRKGFFRKAQALLGMNSPNQAYKYLLIALNNLSSSSSSASSLEEKKSIAVERRQILQEIQRAIHLKNRKMKAEGRGEGVRIVFFEEHNKGQGLVAERDFSAGEVIFEDTPLVAARYEPLVETKDSVCCAHCFRSLVPLRVVKKQLKQAGNKDPLQGAEAYFEYQRNAVRCAECDTELYCCEQCQTTAWDQYHSELCTRKQEDHPVNQLYQRAKEVSTPDEPHLYIVRLTARLVATQICRLKHFLSSSSEEDVSSDKSPVDELCDPFRAFSSPSIPTVYHDKPELLRFFCNKLEEALGPSRPYLRSSSSLDSSSLKAAAKLSFLFTPRAFEQMFVQYSMNSAKFIPKTPLESWWKRKSGQRPSPLQLARKELLLAQKMEVPEELLGGTSTITTNRRRKDTMSKWPGSCELGGLFEVHAMLNHSRERSGVNAVVSDRFEEGRIAVVAFRNVAAGEELLIDYLMGVEDPALRRQLEEDYLITSS